VIEVVVTRPDEDVSIPAAAAGAALAILVAVVRFLYITAVALVLAEVDWAAKAWALDQLWPDRLVLNTDRPWHAS